MKPVLEITVIHSDRSNKPLTSSVLCVPVYLPALGQDTMREAPVFFEHSGGWSTGTGEGPEVGSYRDPPSLT